MFTIGVNNVRINDVKTSNNYEKTEYINHIYPRRGVDLEIIL